MFDSVPVALRVVNQCRPKYVFLTAKSGAGKTYFSKQMNGYKVLELDAVVRSVGAKYGIKGPKAFAMYKSGLAASVMTAFVKAIHTFFEKNLTSPIVVEGAISDAALINRIFSGPYSIFTFIYLYPNNIDGYVARMMKRFREEKKSGVRSLSIWPDVTPELEAAPLSSQKLKTFMRRMARESINKSKERYKYFENARFHIYRVDV